MRYLPVLVAFLSLFADLASAKKIQLLSGKPTTNFKKQRKEIQVEQALKFHSSISRQLVLIFKNKIDRNSVQKILPSGTVFSAFTPRVSIVEVRYGKLDFVAAKLRKSKLVQSVYKNEVAVIRQESEMRRSRTGNSNSEDSGSSVCFNGSVCEVNNRGRLWAQNRVNADLMNREMQRLGIPRSSVHVAVLDTGFDMSNNAANMAQIPVVRPAVDSATQNGPNITIGSLTHDEEGHGTAVSGLISGRNGVGVSHSADLTVYRVTSPNAGGETGTGVLAAGMIRACEEGNEVINLSWGGLSDEAGIIRDESNQALMDVLTERGCLVVKAAGNSSYRDTRPTNLDDAILRVEASNSLGSVARFSSAGEVVAPGEGVFTLTSSDLPSDERPEERRLCGQYPGAFINGTSFAAPITAAIASDVFAVLKAAPNSTLFSSLPGRDRIQLVNRILSASVHGGSIDGLRAVRIASLWKINFQAGMAALSVEQMKSLLNSNHDERCSSGAGSCMNSVNEESCLDLENCYLTMRERASLCSSVNTETLNFLLGTSFRANNPDETLGFLSLAQSNNREQQQLLRRYSEQLVQFYRNRWRHVDPQCPNYYCENPDAISQQFNERYAADVPMLMELLPHYFNSRANNIDVRSDAESWIGFLLNASESSTRAETSPGKGSEEYFNNLARTLLVLRSKTTDEAFLAILEEKVREAQDSGSTSNSKLLAMIRLYNALIEQAGDESFRQRLITQERILFEHFKSNTLMTTIERLDYLTPMITRNRNALLQLVNADQEHLGAVYRNWLVSHLEEVPENTRTDFLVDTLNRIGSSPNSEYLFASYRQVSLALAVRMSESEEGQRVVLQQRLLEVLSNGAPSRVATLFNYITRDRDPASWDAAIILTDTGLTPVQFQQLAPRVWQGLVSGNEAPYLLGDAISRLIPWMMYADRSGLKQEANFQSMAVKAITSMTIEPGTNYSLNNNRNQWNRILFDLVDVPGIRNSIQRSPEFMEQFQTFATQVNANRSSYPSSFLRDFDRTAAILSVR